MWLWLLVAFGALVGVYVALLGLLLVSGRRTDARALAGFIPDCCILCVRLLRDPRVPRRRKALLLALIGYLAFPLDPVPDFLPVIGQIDDLLVAALVLRRLIRSDGEALIREHWPGPEKSLKLILALA